MKRRTQYGGGGGDGDRMEQKTVKFIVDGNLK